MRFREVVQHGLKDISQKDFVVWPRDPISPDLDLRHVHVLLMVRLHGACLLSAHGPWLPEDDTISLSMTPQVPSFTTPVPIFGPVPATLVDGDSQTEKWLETADAVRARHLGTFYSAYAWEKAGFETTMNGADINEENELQVDVHLLKVCPGGSGCDTGPRTFKFAPLVSRAGRFRTQTCHFPGISGISGISIDGGKIKWELSPCHDFQDWDSEVDEEDEPWGTSEDGIGIPSFINDSWLDTELALTSPLPSGETSPGDQVHTIESISLKIVWQSGDVQHREPLNLLPCRQVFQTFCNGTRPQGL